MSTPASTTVLLNRVKNTSAVSAANAVNVSNGAAAERIVAINVDGASAAAFACSSTCKLPVNSPNTTMVLHTHSLSGDGTGWQHASRRERTSQKSRTPST